MSRQSSDLQSQNAWVARVSCALIAALLAHNAYWIVRNQATLSKENRLHKSPKRLEAVALAHHNRAVSGNYAVFHFLGEAIGGASLAIPPAWEEHRWMLERLSRLQVAGTERPLVVDPARVEHLRGLERFERNWAKTKRRDQALLLMRDKGAKDYVIAESPNGKRLYILPKTRFPEAAFAKGASSP